MLAVDARYRHGAKVALAGAVAATKVIGKAKMRVARHQAAIDRVNEMHENGEIDDSAHSTGKPPPLVVRLAEVRPFLRAPWLAVRGSPFVNSHVPEGDRHARAAEPVARAMVLEVSRRLGPEVPAAGDLWPAA